MGELTSDNWHIAVKILLAILINSLTILCVLMKIVFVLWLSRLEKKQADYLNSLDEEFECTDGVTQPVWYIFHSCEIIVGLNIIVDVMSFLE